MTAAGEVAARPPRRSSRVSRFLRAVAVIAVALGGATWARSAGPTGEIDGSLGIEWWTTDGGGGVSSNGDLTLTGTMGQHDTGVSTAADFVLAGGFWRGSALVEPSCPEDLDEGGSVDVADLLAVLAAWGTGDGDVTGDGVTDVADLLAVLAAWGPCA